MRTSLLLLGVVVAGCSRPVKPVVLSGRVLLPSGATYGQVFIGADGKIACAAASCEGVKGYAEALQLELGDAVISPGLINAHGHTEYDTVGPQQHGATRYQHRHDWRVGPTALPEVKRTEDRATLVAAELRSVLGGCTSLLSSGGQRGLARNLTANDDALREGLTDERVTFDTFPLGDQAGVQLASGCDYPAITTPAKAFAAGSYATHVGEGINAFAKNELACVGGLLSARTSVIHAVAADARDVDAMRSVGARLIWSPRSNLGLYGDTAPVTVFKTMNVPIALGTDWLASGSMNLLRELSCADSFNRTRLAGRFSGEELWKMVTANAALASGFESELGALREGLAGDVTVFSGNDDYRTVLGASVEDVKLVARGGHPLSGDAELVKQLQEGCTPLDVCGTTRAVCLEDTGATLAEVQAAAKTYPLFFCRDTVPTEEPSCVPSRESYDMGVTAFDRDGDGQPDVTDDCPTVFNPVRPDANAQADVDGDGVGDACDSAPLDPSRG